MSADRELLEWAAKAAGIEYDAANRSKFGLLLVFHDEPGPNCRRYWNPIKDDGDAFRLSAKLKLSVLHGDFSVVATDEGLIDESSFVPDESQRLYGTRESIVRAAAEIGRDMQ